jgi:hypothetical protein
MSKGLQTPLGQKLGLAFDSGNCTHDIFIEARRKTLGLDVGDETVLVTAADEILELSVVSHGISGINRVLAP